MLKIQPSILIGIGHRATRTIHSYTRRIQTEQEKVPVILPLVIEFSAQTAAPQRETNGIQYITLLPPEFSEDEWPAWLPGELRHLEKEHTRAWMRAALFQQADDLHEFLVENIPHLSSLTTVEKLNELGMSLAGNSQVNVYVIADLNDHLGSSVFIDIAYLTAHICQQLGLTPQVSGLLYLPNAISPAPAEEAIAYAALKELEHYASGHRYDAELLPATSDRLPELFNDGCYLLDTVNELGYVLQDESQQISAVSEWLYAMTFLNVAVPLREKLDLRYATAKLRSKSRNYASLGIAVRYVPQKLLTDWMATRLSGDILAHISSPLPSPDAEKQVNAFMQRVGLSAEALQGRLEHQNIPDIDGTLNALGHTPLGQIEWRVRQTLQTMREQHLLDAQRNLNQNLQRTQVEIQEGVNATVEIALEDVPVGNLSTARQFLNILQDQILAQQNQVEEQRQQHRLRLRRSLSSISNAQYALRSVSMSIPPWPVMTWGAIAVLLLPLTYSFQLAWKVIAPLDEMNALVTLGLLIVGIMAVLGVVIFRSMRQVRAVNKQHISMVRERFDLESAPLVYRTMSETYHAAQGIVEQAQAQIDRLTAQVQAVAASVQSSCAQHAEMLDRLSVPGPLRSMIDTAQAETLYRHLVLERAEVRFQRNVPTLDSLIAEFTEENSPVSKWQHEAARTGQSLEEWLEERLLAFSRYRVHKQVQAINVLDLIKLDKSDSNLQQAIAHMLDSAQPLWNHDPDLLGRAKTQRLTAIGVSGTGSFQPSLTQACPDAILVDTGDVHSMVLINVHRGLPLFTMRRLQEYRAHYVAMLQHSKLPLHNAYELTLADDLFPIRTSKQLAPIALFAAGVALGLISRDPNGRYLVPRDATSMMRLSADKARAVALMGMDASMCKEVQQRLNALVSSKGPEAIRSILDEYTAVVPHLEHWEVKGIVEFGQIYGIETDNG